jgi:adenylate kinase family enzyme
MEEEPIVVKYIKDRIHHRNKNFLMLFVGATGSGKSYSALRLAEMLDKDFNVDYCCFRALDFMNKINELTSNNESVSGKVVLWDEFGVEHSAREFMTISNRVINYFFQTSRHLNLIVIMTVPLLSFVDSATRKLCHAVAEMQGINTSKKMSSVKVKMIQTNVLTGKEYPKYLRYRKKNKLLVSKRMNFNLPSKELIEAYENKKKEFTARLNREIINRLLKVEEKEKKRAKPLTDKQQKIAELLSKQSIEETSKQLNLTITTIYAHKTNMEKKGVVFRPIWENRRIMRYKIENLD